MADQPDLGPARNFIGYGNDPPDPKWPGGARLALSLVINYEEGGERGLTNGDNQGETHLTEYVSHEPAPIGERLLARLSRAPWEGAISQWG